MSNILASGTTEADSSTVTLVAGDSCLLFLVGPVPNDARAVVSIQASDSSWTPIGELSWQFRSAKLDSAGTFKVTRLKSSVAFAVDKV